MFEALAEKLQSAFQRLRGNAKLSEADVDAAMREVRMALLEADVNFRVVRDFVARVKERAIGELILEGLNPGQQVIKIVHEELIRLLSGDTKQDDEEATEETPAETAAPEAPAPPKGMERTSRRVTAAMVEPIPIHLGERKPAVLMLCGLQGAGKTTLAGKLAKYLQKQGKTVVLAACDIQRPAAIKQLQVVGEQVKTPVFTLPGADPVRIASEATQWAKDNRVDVVVLDTAGRLHVDDALMDELRGIRDATQPDDVLLVLDAMTGQDAVNVAKEFNDAIGVGGFVLTKVDGDTRGGAAISVRAVVGKPIKLIGLGEKMDALEPFYPDRMASRILGMGDVLSLIEKAEAALDEKKAAEMEKKLRAGKFDFEDFLDQMQQMKRLGPLQDILKLLPGVGSQIKIKDEEFAAGEKELARVEAVVRSMTKAERRNPDIINGSRRKRIAAGAGTGVEQVNQVLKQFDQMRQFMKGMATGKLPGMPGMGRGMGPMAHPGARKKDKKNKGSGGNSSGGGKSGPGFRFFGRG